MFKLIEAFDEKAFIALKNAKFKLRPNASLGIWACMLLPTAILLSAWKFKMQLSIFYKLIVIAVLGIIFINLALIYSLSKKTIKLSKWIILLISLITSFLFWVCIKKDLLYSTLSAFGIIVGYSYLLPFCIYSLPLAFTFGEASICAQGLTLFLYSAAVNILDMGFINCGTPYTNIKIADTVLQIGILGVCLIVTVISSCKKLQSTFGFYLTLSTVVILIVIPIMHILLDRSPLLWLLMFMFDNLKRIYILLYWSLCVALAVFLMYIQAQKNKKASTALRKYFHLLAVIIYIPGILYELTLLYIATGVVFALFIIVEIIRMFNIYPFGKILQLGFKTYVDEKDAAQVALTPMYLLVGCTLPIWLHPNPFWHVNSSNINILPLLAGLLSIGIGDTMASIIGSNFGNHYWKDSRKSIEGSASNAASQFLFLLVLAYIGCIQYNYYNFLQSIFAIVINTLVEAKTDQVDNLILPIVTYIILL